MIKETLWRIYFERIEKEGKPWFKRRRDGVEFPCYLFEFYSAEQIQEIAEGKSTPKFLVD